MRYLGARVIVTPRAGKGTGMVIKAQELAPRRNRLRNLLHVLPWEEALFWLVLFA